MALILDEQVEKHNKGGKTLVQYIYSSVSPYDYLLQVTWKVFVEEKSLVPLDKASYYLATLKLGNDNIYIGHRIKLTLKLQLPHIDTLTLLIRADTI